MSAAERNERLMRELSNITDPDLVCGLEVKQTRTEIPEGDKKPHNTEALNRFLSNISNMSPKSIDHYVKSRQHSTGMINLESLISKLHK